MRGLAVTLVISGVSLLLPLVAFGKVPAVDAARTQLTTAIFHSGELAQRGTAIAGTQLHLRHVINCLEGDKGPNFTQAAGYPCQGQGNGILNDLRTAVAAEAPGSEQALRFADVALKLSLQAVVMTDVNAAQPWAAVIS
ncbi:MAG TPA: hypothetical protein VGR25_04970, partial [bacterium]|nr:hypothetical protein [bacterium]